MKGSNLHLIPQKTDKLEDFMSIRVADQSQSTIDYAKDRGNQQSIEALPHYLVKEIFGSREESYESIAERIRSKNQVDLNPRFMPLFTAKKPLTASTSIQPQLANAESNKDCGMNLKENNSTVPSTNILSRVSHEKNKFSQNTHSQFLRNFDEDSSSFEEDSKLKSIVINNLFQEQSKNILELMNKIEPSEHKSNNSKLQSSNLHTYLNENPANPHRSKKKLLSNEKIVTLHKGTGNPCDLKESQCNISNRNIPYLHTLSADNTYGEKITNSVSKPFSIMNGFTLNNICTIENCSIGDDFFNHPDSSHQGGNQTFSNDYNSLCCDVFHDKGKVLAFFKSGKNGIIETQRDVMINSISIPLRNANVRQTEKKIDEELNMNLEQVKSEDRSDEEVEIEIEEEEVDQEKEDDSKEDFQVTRADEIPSYVTSDQRTMDNYDKEKEVRDFLKCIGLERYTQIFVEQGFDDIKQIIEQMKKTGTGISDSNLKNSGISLAGDRAKIIIKLEEESKILDFPLPHGKVYYQPLSRTKDHLTDNHVQSIYKWLSTLKLEQYTVNFTQAGYYSIELLFMQMLSQNPLTEAVLEKEIEIKKIGYRVRLLNKLREDSKAYFHKLKNSELNLDHGKEYQPDSCKCPIF